MKTMYKVLICLGIGICFIIAGVSLGGLKDVYPFELIGNLNLHWNPHSIEDMRYTANSYTDELELNVHRGNVQFQIRDDIKDIQIQASQIYSGFEIYQKGDKIVIDQPHYWRWFHDYDLASIQINVPKDYVFDKVNINMNAGSTRIDQLKTKKLDIDTAAGRLELNDTVCNDLNLDAAMGQTVLNRLTCENKLDIDLGMGTIDIMLTGHKNEYNYSVDVGLGNVNLGNERFSGIANRKSNYANGQKHIDVNCGIGNVNIEMEGY